MKTQRGGSGRDLPIHNIGGARQGWVANTMPSQQNPWQRDPVPIVQKTGWTSGPVQTCTENAPTRIQTPNHPASSTLLTNYAILAACLPLHRWLIYSLNYPGFGILYVMHKHFYDLITSEIYRVSQEECARLRESVPYVKLYRYNPKHLYPKLNGYGGNGQRKVRFHILHLFSWRVTCTLRMSLRLECSQHYAFLPM